MNFAFPAFAIFLLLLPGAVARYSYSRGSWGWSSPTSMKSVLDEAAYAVFFSILLNSAWVIASGLIGKPIDLRILISLLAPGSSEASDATANAVGSDLPYVLLYFGSLLPLSAVLGYFAHVLVRARQLDHRFRVLRFNNYWYYLLTGEMALFPNSKMGLPKVDGVYLSAVVDCQIGSVLYRGIVKDFTFDSSGRLDTILLIEAERRLLAEDYRPEGRAEGAGADGRYYSIVGDLFVLKYVEIKTLNLDYFYFEDEISPVGA